MPSPIIARADALMQRRRQSSGETGDIPVLTDVHSADDIPVLLDVIDALNLQPPFVAAAENTETAPVPQAAPFSEAMIQELTRRLEQRLAAELPQLVEATIRDFLNEHIPPS